MCFSDSIAGWNFRNEDTLDSLKNMEWKTIPKMALIDVTLN